MEDGDHILFSCPFAKGVWSWFVGWWDVCLVLPSSLDVLLGPAMGGLFMGALRRCWMAALAALLWSLWLCRNEAVFNGKIDLG
ncbi:hypothetical protein GQ457_02G019570 [Hibiscus cannabinus]